MGRTQLICADCAPIMHKAICVFDIFFPCRSIGRFCLLFGFTASLFLAFDLMFLEKEAVIICKIVAFQRFSEGSLDACVNGHLQDPAVACFNCYWRRQTALAHASSHFSGVGQH